MMVSLLPANAERYLQRLEAALWPLPSDERDTILLELRSHLTDCFARGADRLVEAIASLGTAEQCARAFISEGAGETYRLTGKASGEHTSCSPEYAQDIGALGWRSVLSSVRATYLASRDHLWSIGILVLTVMTATNFLIYIAVLHPGTVEIWPLTIIRFSVLLVAMAAAYRSMLTEDANVWAFNLSSLRTGAALAAMYFCTLAAGLTAKSLLDRLDAPLALRAVVLIAVLLGASLTLLRVHPWIAALATGRRDMTLRRVAAGMRGKMKAVLKGWAMLVLPLTLAHFGTVLIVRASEDVHGLHLLLAGFDGIISMGILLAMTLLNATAFRWAAGDPTPGVRRFSEDVPDERLVEEARARLKRHIETRLLAM